jgi:hypothetical protein
MLGLLVILVGLLFGFLVGSPFPIHFPANRAPRQPDERVGFLSMNHLKMVDLIHNEIELTSNFLPSFLPSFVTRIWISCSLPHLFVLMLLASILGRLDSTIRVLGLFDARLDTFAYFDTDRFDNANRPDARSLQKLVSRIFGYLLALMLTSFFGYLAICSLAWLLAWLLAR